jgi:hypothetical protein
MKKLLLSIVSVFMLFALSAQISDNFSDYTVGGKLAQQAQAMGRDYWTTWSGVVGGSEDGVIAEIPAGNKALFLNYNNDQLLELGKKSTGTWIHTFKIYIPANKDAYFNIQADFTGGQDGVWAFECYMATSKPTQSVPTPALTPGLGNFYAGKATTTTFTFTHDTWIPVKVIINLDDDEAEFYVNNDLVHSWQYSLGNSGAGGCPKVIDAFNIFPPVSTARSSFYIDDVVFEKEASSIVIHENGFDDQSGFVAQSYPEFWQTWSNNPGTSEDAVISSEQAVSPPNSAKCIFTGSAANPTGTDLIFKTGEPTTGTYTVDFDMYIPNGVPAYFNLLNNFVPANPNACQWAIGVYFNITPSSDFPATGTYIQQNDIITNFTAPSNTWFPVSMYVNLDEDVAKISINGTQLLTWQYSIDETGDPAPRKLAAVDFYPPQPTSVFYIDNFKYASLEGDDPKFPIMGVDPDEITETVIPGENFTKTITVENTGTAIGEFTSWIEFDFEPIPGTTNYTLLHGNGAPNDGGVGYPVTEPMLLELGAKFSGSKICDKVGTYINKLSYYVPTESSGGITVTSLVFRIYGPSKSSAPGEELVKVTKTGLVGDTWNEVTLTTPILIDKNELWISVEFTHNVGAYPVGIGGTGVEGVNFTRRNGGNWQPFNQWDEFGNFLVRAHTQGTVVPACWMNLTGEPYGSVPKGTSKTYNAVFNSGTLAEGVYKANIKIKTDDPDPERELFTIPCIITVGSYSLMSVDPTEIEEEIDVIEGEENTITVQVTITNSGNASGDYFVKEPTVEWLSFSGDLIGTLQPGESATFDVILDANELEEDTYETDIEIAITDISNDLITIPCTLIVNVEEGVGEYSIKTLVFPNPATNNVTISSTQNINSVQIINFVGQTVYSANVNGKNTNINTSNLTGGIYFVRVNTEVGSQNVKLIIK